MFGNMGNMQKMLKQVQKMQQDMAKLQEELNEKTVEATSGGGMVKAVVNGKQELVSLTINPQAVDPEDVEMLVDMITAAVNEALRKSKDMVAEEMNKITGGLNLNLPGLF
ncbi:nucleoid-associated protein, YbaB/EbfC family [Carboxydothermus islandicus]|uniref:Nucleoid-associated protein ciss_00410 n=1 Tax=Carboxydothermus islandicus TaxID=661089 RepID=A0A1L8CYW6_9THEO|nr:YbaB/EbfC family nucleoid-associated protein [Carboxydothermus islandicus]GAV24108.1 nucleoid-associated protein, YbaB/EbfC family [Carboxydothermus islandicus]